MVNQDDAIRLHVLERAVIILCNGAVWLPNCSLPLAALLQSGVFCCLVASVCTVDRGVLVASVSVLQQTAALLTNQWVALPTTPS